MAGASSTRPVSRKSTVRFADQVPSEPVSTQKLLGDGFTASHFAVHSENPGSLRAMDSNNSSMQFRHGMNSNSYKIRFNTGK